MHHFHTFPMQMLTYDGAHKIYITAIFAWSNYQNNDIAIK